ncbi:DUF1844 domain-containing protein [Candidatus Margulisiibacteriota bacterium]
MADQQQLEAMFISLVFTYHQSAMFAMGKMANPISGKIEKSLPQAKNAIDTLEMLIEKTKGNLSEKEDKFLKTILQELRLNYVYEVEQSKTQSTEETTAETKEEASQAEEQEIPETEEQPVTD